MNDASAANSSSDFAESTQRKANHHDEEVGLRGRQIIMASRLASRQKT